MDARFWDIADTLKNQPLAGLWKLLYFGFASDPISVAGTRLTVLYSIVPWIGVMALGYVFGPVMTMDASRRRRWCLALGGAAIALFLLLRGFDLYGDPNPWRPAPPATAQDGTPRPAMPPALRFLNTNKYPASLLFLLMTLGPTLVAIPLLETARGPLARAFEVYGRVPFFYYVLHIPLIHLAAIAVSLAREGRIDPVAPGKSPDGQSSASAGVRLEPALALRGDARGRGDPLPPLPLDGRAQAAAREDVAVAAVRLTRRSKQTDSSRMDVRSPISSRGQGGPSMKWMPLALSLGSAAIVVVVLTGMAESASPPGPRFSVTYGPGPERRAARRTPAR